MRKITAAIVIFVGIIAIVAIAPVTMAWARSGHAGPRMASAQQKVSHLTSAQSQLIGPACRTWQVVPSPNPTSFGSQLTAVTMLSSQDAWAVGWYDTASNGPAHTLIEHWNGITWSIVASPNAETGDNALWAVTAATADDVWAVGYSSNSNFTSALIEHWDGATWTIVASPALSGDSRLLAVTMLGTKAWAVGQQGSSSLEPVAEAWDGSTWSLAKLPSIGAEAVLNGVAAVSDGTVWATGSFESTAGSNFWQTLIERWDGSSWAIVPSPNVAVYSDGLGSVTATSPSNVWAVGHITHSVFNTQVTMMAHWDGTSWQLVPARDIGFSDTNNVLTAVAPLAGGEAIAVGSAYAGAGFVGFQQLAELGTTAAFQVIPTPVQQQDVGEGLWGVASASDGDVLAVGAAETSGQNVVHTLVERYAPGQC